MNTRNDFFTLLFVFLFAAGANSNATARVAEFYSAIQGNDSTMINAQLAVLEKSTLKEKDAYMGALTMKKSGMQKGGLEKLQLFKKGRMMLEACIKNDSSNAEYRFIRLIIQENVPDFLNYHSKKEEDAKMIRQSFHKLTAELQEAIKSYSKTSHLLKPEDFKKAER